MRGFPKSHDSPSRDVCDRVVSQARLEAGGRRPEGDGTPGLARRVGSKCLWKGAGRAFPKSLDSPSREVCDRVLSQARLEAGGRRVTGRRAWPGVPGRKVFGKVPEDLSSERSSGGAVLGTASAVRVGIAGPPAGRPFQADVSHIGVQAAGDSVRLESPTYSTIANQASQALIEFAMRFGSAKMQETFSSKGPPHPSKSFSTTWAARLRSRKLRQRHSRRSPTFRTCCTQELVRGELAALDAR